MAPSPSTCAPDGDLDPMDVCVVGVASTPIDAFLGCLSSLPATKLSSVAIQDNEISLLSYSNPCY